MAGAARKPKESYSLSGPPLCNSSRVNRDCIRALLYSDYTPNLLQILRIRVYVIIHSTYGNSP